MLIYADANIQAERRTVPHVGVLERDFVVIPLLDLDANLSVKGQLLKHSPLLEHPNLTVVDADNWAGLKSFKLSMRDAFSIEEYFHD